MFRARCRGTSLSPERITSTMRASPYVVAYLGFIQVILASIFVEPATAYDALFVVGDSYADTGNHDKDDARRNAAGEPNNRAWREPYGATWPGTPSGRYSDARVFTDFYASRLNVAPPVPYNMINNNNTNLSQRFRAGINFAYGGSGALSALGPDYPTLGKQVQQLKNLTDRGFVSKDLVTKSTCLVVVAGNDYSIFLASNPLNSINAYIPRVVGEIIVQVEALYRLGFKAIAVTNLEPIGCLPLVTYLNNFTSCNETINSAISGPHNLELSSKIANLQLRHLTARFIVIDFFTSYYRAIGANLTLSPCCQGINGALCGAVDNNGLPLYTICPNPQGFLFWDLSHPTDYGWASITDMALAFV